MRLEIVESVHPVPGISPPEDLSTFLSLLSSNTHGIALLMNFNLDHLSDSCCV